MNDTDNSNPDVIDAFGVVVDAVRGWGAFQGAYIVTRIENGERRLVVHDYDGHAWVVTVEPLQLP